MSETENEQQNSEQTEIPQEAEAVEAAVEPGEAEPLPEEVPGEAGEEERDAELHPGEQERVVVGARVARRADVPPDVDPVGKAAAGELRDER